MNLVDKIAVVVSNDNKNVSAKETIDAIKKAGFKNVFIQWYNKEFEIPQEEQLKLIQKAGLNVIFAHLGYQKINTIWEDDSFGDSHVERYKNDLKICKENGINLVCMHVVSKSIAPEFSEIGLKRIREITNYAKEIGIKISFENTKLKGYIEPLLNNIQDNHVGFCLDVGHYHAHFKDDFDFSLVNNRIFAIHLHDNNGEKDEHLIPYDGTLDWNDVLNKLNDCNFDGMITLELCYQNDYLNQSVDEFYRKGFEVALRLAEQFEDVKSKKN